MASISAQTEMDARGTSSISRCDDCGCDHGAYAVTQRGADYLLCESCYEYACAVAEEEDDAGEQEDDFLAEEEEEEPLVGSAEWWAEGEQDARDNGAYGLLTSVGW